MTSCLSVKAWGEEEEAEDSCDYDTGLTKQLLCILGTWFPQKWLHIHLPVGMFCFCKHLLISLLSCHFFWLEVFLLSFYFCLVWWKKSVSKRHGRDLADGRSQPTTPSFKSIVPGLFVHFVQGLFKYKIYKLFWVKTRTRIPLAALFGVMDVRLLNNSLSCEKLSVHFYIYFSLGEKVRGFNACSKIMKRIWLKLTLRCDSGNGPLRVPPRDLCSIQ